MYNLKRFIHRLGCCVLTILLTETGGRTGMWDHTVQYRLYANGLWDHAVLSGWDWIMDHAVQYGTGLWDHTVQQNLDGTSCIHALMYYTPVTAHLPSIIDTAVL